MGPYGLVWADIKTGKSPMAQDHFQTPPDPKKVPMIWNVRLSKLDSGPSHCTHACNTFAGKLLSVEDCTTDSHEKDDLAAT